MLKTLVLSVFYGFDPFKWINFNLKIKLAKQRRFKKLHCVRHTISPVDCGQCTLKHSLKNSWSFFEN